MVDADRVEEGRDSLRVMGIDPGSRVTGYGVIEKTKNSIEFIACGVIKTSPKLPLSARLQEIYDGIAEVIVRHQPVRAAVEDIFVAVNPSSALKLGHARGVIILAIMQHNLSIHEYSPKIIKQAVVGYGQAGKPQVQQMVRTLLKLSTNPSYDAADALAAALCCLNHYRTSIC